MKASPFLLGCLLCSLLAGCGERSARITPESEVCAAESTVPVESPQDGTAASAPASEFPFPADKGGRLLADRLRPASQIPHLPEDKPAVSKRLAGPAKLENPELSLPHVLVPTPPSIPLAKTKL